MSNDFDLRVFCVTREVARFCLCSTPEPNDIRLALFRRDTARRSLTTVKNGRRDDDYYWNRADRPFRGIGILR